MNNQLEIYVLRDQKLDGYLNPIFMQSRGQVIRWLTDLINKVNGAGGEDSLIAQHPEDFELFLVGMWDARSGEITVDKPVSVVLCKDLVVQKP